MLSSAKAQHHPDEFSSRLREPLRPLGFYWLRAEGEGWHAQVSNLIFNQSLVVVAEGELNLSLQQCWYVS